jgi:CRISPR/Cas system type I-B associated protein Csh2 (Cas7 group RAMP superfamily)
MAVMLVSCGKGKIEAGSPEEVLSLVKERGNGMGVFELYTDDTISLMKKYMKITGMKNETSADILSFIPEGAEYKINSKKIDGNRCDIEIVFTKHGSENASGQVIMLKMRKKGNGWKIDREDDFRKLIDSYEKRGVENYLDRIR